MAQQYQLTISLVAPKKHRMNVKYVHRSERKKYLRGDDVTAIAIAIISALVVNICLSFVSCLFKRLLAIIVRNFFKWICRNLFWDVRLSVSSRRNQVWGLFHVIQAKRKFQANFQIELNVIGLGREDITS